MKDLLQELETLGFERTLLGLNIPHTYVDCRNSEIDSILVYPEDCSVVQVKKEKTGGFKVTPCKSITSYNINNGPIMIADPPGKFIFFNNAQGVLDYICRATLKGSFLDEPEKNLQGDVIKYVNTSSTYSWSTTTYNAR